METAHRLPRFFVLWWTLATATSLVVLPLAIAVRGRWGRVDLIVLADVGVLALFSGLVFLGAAQAAAIRHLGVRVRVGRWIGWTAGGWIVGYLVGGFTGVLAFFGALLALGTLAPEMIFLPLWFSAVAFAGGVGGALLGISVTTFQAFELVRASSGDLGLWRVSGLLGWIPFGVVFAVALSYTSMVGLQGEPVPSWVVSSAVLALLGALVLPGLLTGLALKRIVEAAPARTEAPAPGDIEA